MRAYVLIEASVGKSRGVYEGVRDLHLAQAGITSVDVVTGPFDVIALLEADDLDRLGQAVADGIQKVDGVQRTTTCLLLQLS